MKQYINIHYIFIINTLNYLPSKMQIGFKKRQGFAKKNNLNSRKSKQRTEMRTIN